MEIKTKKQWEESHELVDRMYGGSDQDLLEFLLDGFKNASTPLLIALNNMIAIELLDRQEASEESSTK